MGPTCVGRGSSNGWGKNAERTRDGERKAERERERVGEKRGKKKQHSALPAVVCARPTLIWLFFFLPILCSALPGTPICVCVCVRLEPGPGIRTDTTNYTCQGVFFVVVFFKGIDPFSFFLKNIFLHLSFIFFFLQKNVLCFFPNC